MSTLLSDRSVEPGIVTVAQPIANESIDESRKPRWIRRIIAGAGWIAHWQFGLVSLIVILAVLAVAPILQLFTFGYFLDAAGRAGRGERWSTFLPGIPLAAKIGGIFLGITILSIPIWIIEDFLADSRLIDPSSNITHRLDTAAGIVGLMTFIQIIVALCRGGRFDYFFRPIATVRWLFPRIRPSGWRGNFIAIGAVIAAVYHNLIALFTGRERADGVGVYGARIRRYFSLGLRGLIGTGIWLVIPSAMMVADKNRPALAFIGGCLLAIVVMYLPFLQARFAAQNRFRAFFDVRAVRAAFRRAPVVYFLALLITLALALPLYLLKIYQTWEEVRWMPAVLFIVTILPLKILAGWSYHCSEQRTAIARWYYRWPSSLLMFPVAGIYVYIAFLAQYTSWVGAQSLIEHHAFLIPSPF